MEQEIQEFLTKATTEMAILHAKVSKGEIPEDEDEMEDTTDDMWYSFAIPDFENSPQFEDLDIYKLIEMYHLQTLYKKILAEELRKKYDLE